MRCARAAWQRGPVPVLRGCQTVLIDTTSDFAIICPARCTPHLGRARRSGRSTRTASTCPVPAGADHRSRLALADTFPARQRRQPRPVGAGEDRRPRPGCQEVVVGAAERSISGLDRPVDRQRMRDGLRVLLCAAAQGIRQPHHGIHQHRQDYRVPRTTHPPARPQTCSQSMRSHRLGVRHRRKQRLQCRCHDHRQHRTTTSPT